ncbi:MAG TPA: hypothetical protein ENF93_00650, partial [Ignisphaera sp.]|nr:hypothetical protein [Ignisphaera sp.]
SMSFEHVIEDLFLMLGLDINTAKVFYAILRLGGRATVNDIIKVLGMSHSKVYKSLSELQRLGLIYSTASRPKMYFISDPNAILRVVQEHSAKLMKLAENVFNVVKVVSSSERVESLCTTLDSVKDVTEMLRYIIQRTQFELMLFMDRATLDEMEAELEEVCSRAFVHIVAPEIIDKMDRLLDYGCTLVSMRQYATRVVAISDGVRTLIAPILQLKINPYERAIYVENEDVAHITSAYFYHRVYASTLVTKHRVVEKRSYVFKSILPAIEFSRLALREGYELYTEVEGLYTYSYDRAVLKGYIYDAFSKQKRGVHGLLVVTPQGLYSVGGFRAFIEDISASTIRIVPTSLPIDVSR